MREDDGTPVPPAPEALPGDSHTRGHGADAASPPPPRVARLGCLTAIGGLAWNAYGRFREQIEREASEVGPGVEFAAWACLQQRDFEAVANEPLARRSRSMLVLRGLSSSALADPRAQRSELRRALRRLAGSRIGGPRAAAMLSIITRALTPGELAARSGDRAVAVSVYAAAVLAADRSVPETRAFLADLAGRLALPALLVTCTHECAVYAMVSGRGGLPRPQAPEWQAPEAGPSLSFG